MTQSTLVMGAQRGCGAVLRAKPMAALRRLPQALGYPDESLELQP